MQVQPVARRPPKLLDQVREANRTRHYNRRTEVAYASWLRQFIVFHQKAHPSTLGAAAIYAGLHEAWLVLRSAPCEGSITSTRLRERELAACA